jgi:inner membrane transporter RhtA
MLMAPICNHSVAFSSGIVKRPIRNGNFQMDRQTDRMARILPFAAVTLSILSVQVGATFAKRLFPLVGAQGTTTLRQVLSALILLALFRPWRKLPPRPAWPALFGLGVVLGVMNLVFYMSLARIPLGIAVAVEFVGPLAVATFTSRHWTDLLWVGTVIVGLLMLLPLGEASHSLDITGLALALGAGVCWGLYIILGRRASAIGTTQATAIAMTIAALTVLPAGVSPAIQALGQPSILLNALAIAVLSSAIPYTCEMFALGRIPVRVFGILMSLEPVVAAIAGFVFLHEALTIRQIVAIAAVVTASLGTAMTMQNQEEVRDLQDHP